MLLALIGVLVLCIAIMWTTRDAMSSLSFLRNRNSAQLHSGGEKTIVDQSPWQTAQALAALAVSTEEHEYAREAERLADHDVDQAFASALREASMRRPVLSSEAQVISERIKDLGAIVKADQVHVDSLTTPSGKGSGTAKGNENTDAAGSDDLEVAKAQLGLDQDELADARQEFARATDDKRPEIQQELAAHEAAMSKYDALVRDGGQVAVLTTGRYGTLASRIRAYFAQNGRYKLLQQAVAETSADIRKLTDEHNAALARANAAQSGATSTAAQTADKPTPGSDNTGSDSSGRIATLRQRSEQRQLVSIYNDRIQTKQQLAAIYGKWANQVLLQHRIVLHLMMQSVAWIVVILICVILGTALVRRVMDKPGLDGRRLRTLRALAQLGVQLLGLALILLVIFGAPSEVSTVVGLTTAGLTVALQAFILAFIGWFILMGKNGLRVGEWVEINGVGGEVIEIGLFRTTLLETGNWTDQGHPTGRRVAFMNNFAITGQYFNFSTVGQWMWDEFAISAPASADTYALVEEIHKGVTEETDRDARLAEAEWQHASRQDGLRQFSAAPSVGLRPSASGVDIVVRYVTRASERFETRNGLYKLVMDVLHKPALQASSRRD
jgi:small-conductance mechanosensitive channel